MSTLLASTATALLIATALATPSEECNFYVERYPQPPFKEMVTHPLGVCTGTRYAQSKIKAESVMYRCSRDKSHVIQYKYTDSSRCTGEYLAYTATRNPSDFVCHHDETCPYIVTKVHVSDKDDLRNWYSSSWVMDACSNGELFSCEDNESYTHHLFDNAECEGQAIESNVYAANEPFGDGLNFYELFCNEPMNDIPDQPSNLPDNAMLVDFTEQDVLEQVVIEEIVTDAKTKRDAKVEDKQDEQREDMEHDEAQQQQQQEEEETMDEESEQQVDDQDDEDNAAEDDDAPIDETSEEEEEQTDDDEAVVDDPEEQSEEAQDDEDTADIDETTEESAEQEDEEETTDEDDEDDATVDASEEQNDEQQEDENDDADEQLDETTEESEDADAEEPIVDAGSEEEEEEENDEDNVDLDEPIANEDASEEEDDVTSDDTEYAEEEEEAVQEANEGAYNDDEEEIVAEEESEEVIDAFIETAICLHGRTEGQHQEMGDEMVNYCFAGYDSVSDKPIYKGEIGEIKWTQSAGSYGGSYGLFLYDSDEDWPVAYCFSEETKDISVCDKQWFVDHGTSARYYKDASMESKECECTLEGMDELASETTIAPVTASSTADGVAASESSDDPFDIASTTTGEDDAAAVPSANVNALESKSNAFDVTVAVMMSGLAMLQMGL